MTAINRVTTRHELAAPSLATPVLVAKMLAVIALTKPRALVLIVYTTCLGYLIAATRAIELFHLAQVAFGVGLAAAGSLALNQHMERHLDAKMTRTRHRPLPAGRLDPDTALVLGWVAMTGGYLYLWFWIGPACSIATMICGFSYLYLYTPLKKKTSYSSWAGAIPGAMLPVMGWLAVRDRPEIGAWILFTILFLWQIPHALIISLRHRDDYHRAGMKQLPLISPDSTTRRHILFNVLALVPVTLLPYFFNMTESLYPLSAVVLGGLLSWATLDFAKGRSRTAANRLFLSLTVYLPLLLMIMYLDKPA